MGGSKALGLCLKRHRGQRTQQVLADLLRKSLRWVLYAEAGRADIGWSELLDIASALGPIDGRAFLDDAVSLLYEEAHVDGTTRSALAAVQRRVFLSVLGAGAVGNVDLERIERILQGLRVDAAAVQDLSTVTRWYASQSRSMAPGTLVAALQGHLRAYLDLVVRGPAVFSQQLKAGAAETALLSGVLALRMGATPEALHYWLIASGLASEGGHDIVSAYVRAMRRTALHNPATRGGTAETNPREAIRLLDEGLALLGPRPTGLAAATLVSWRAGDHASLGDAPATERDLETASQGLSKRSDEDEDLIGMSTATELDLKVERVICALELQQPEKVLVELDAKAVREHPSAGWRAARTSETAAALAQKGEIEHSIRTMTEAAELAIVAREPWRLRWVAAMRKRWLPDACPGADAQELDQKLAAAVPTGG